MKKLLLTTTMLVGLVAVANAATEAGKMYVRGDAGYQFSGSKNEALGTTKAGSRLTVFVGDIGFGYAIADNIRTDVTVSFSNPSGDQKVEKLGDNIQFNDSKLVTALATANAAIDATAGAAATTAFTAASPPASVKLGVATKAVAGTATTGSRATVATPQALLDTANKAADDCAKASQFFAKDTPAKVIMKNRNIGLMANVYYDFSTGSAFTPYVMGGVGVSRSNQQLQLSGVNAVTTTSTPVAGAAQSATMKSANKTGFAYAIGAGVGYEMSKDVVLDVGYKLTGRPSNTYTHKFADGKSMTVGTTTYNKDKPCTSKAPSVTHSFTAGVRFAF